MQLGKGFSLFRTIALVLGNSLFVVASLFMLWQANVIIDVFQHLPKNAFSNGGQFLSLFNKRSFLTLLMFLVHLTLIKYLLTSFANMLTNLAHLFFAEMQFKSLLVFFKCEGTFTESKISTGKGIYDSTQSENTLVRSSITPWIIASNITSTTFASTGMSNLEHPRYILELHKADMELAEIKKDIIAFLKDRESIATITSERDLGNTSQIHQLNQQTRAMPNQQNINPQMNHDAEAAGYIQQDKQPKTAAISQPENSQSES
ncbi:MAG: hypothetical protein Q9M92_13055 [Enterobacterales bacterium]|nr:hypothetical protein [Enterobacterales bacterium]